MKRLITLFSLFGIFFLLSPESTAQIPIRETTPFPDSVIYAASATLPDGKVMVWGGQKLVKTPSDKIWLSKKSYVYDPVAETWSAGPDLNEEVISPSVVTLPNGNIVSMGGQGYKTISVLDSIPLRTDQVEMYDVSSGMWIELDTIPFGSSPYTRTSSIVTPQGHVWLTSTNGDYGLFDTDSMYWVNQTSLFGPLDAGGSPMVNLNNGQVFLTGAGGQLWDIANDNISYVDPPLQVYSQGGAVVQLTDGRTLTWDKAFSFSQQAFIVSESGTSSALTDSLAVPGQITTGVRMPNGEVWAFGIGEVTGPYTLLQIFDPVTETWSVPGTYDFRPEVFTGYHLHLLQDSSILILTTAEKSYRINAGAGQTAIQHFLMTLYWDLIYDARAEVLHVQPQSKAGMEKVNFSLIDLQGKVLVQESLFGQARDFSLHHLPQGIYIARLSRENGAFLYRKIRVE